MPQNGELLGRVVKLVGGDNIIVKGTNLSYSWKD
jgi:hypothetical protein